MNKNVFILNNFQNVISHWVGFCQTDVSIYILYISISKRSTLLILTNFELCCYKWVPESKIFQWAQVHLQWNKTTENLCLSKIRLKYKKWSISSCIFYSLCFFFLHPKNTGRLYKCYATWYYRWLMHGSDWAVSITRKINKRIEKFGYNFLWCIVVLLKNSNESFITTSHNWMHIYIIHCYKTVKVFEN